MFIDKAEKYQIEKYKLLLKAAGYLTKLTTSAESGINRRALDSNTLEIIFAKCFGFTDVSKKDEAIDCYRDDLGIGLKTFGCDGYYSFEKVAEFNASYDIIDSLRSKPEILIRHLTRERNQRIQTTLDRYGLKNTIYHCITRNKNGNWYVIEESMDRISENNFEIQKVNDKTIFFNDENGEYKFNFSKSVIMKKFNNTFPYEKIKIDIAKDPFEILEKIAKN